MLRNIKNIVIIFTLSMILSINNYSLANYVIKNASKQSISNIHTVQNSEENIQIQVINPWVRATVIGQKQSGAFLSIKTTQNLSLIEAYTSIAQNIEIHSMSMENNTMLMEKVNKIEIPKNKIIDLRGNYHLMLFDLKQSLQINSYVPIQLIFIDKNHKKISYEFKAIVKPIYYMDK